MKNSILAFIFCLLISSCSFNGMFYETENAKDYPIEKANIDNVQEFFLENEDGIKIHTAFVPSTESTIKGSVFMLHGNAGPISTWLGMSSMYTSQGFHFYVMDYQGFGKSEGMPTHKNVLADAQLSFNHFKSLKDINSHPIIIHGISIGGHLSVNLTENNAKHIAVLVLDEAFPSHRKTAFQNAPFLLKPFVPILVRNHYSAIKSIQQFEKSLLIMASDQDQVAPWRFSQKLYDEAASTQKELWNIGGKHMEGLYPNRKEYISKLEALIKTSTQN